MFSLMGSKILVVGCGGLGCELIKILAADHTNDITVVDDDTIDLTNLNRQFFFVKEDVNKSKSEVVCEKIVKKDNHPKISFIFSKIDSFKKLEYYKNFDVVYNCLDNDYARSFVNQRCLLAKVRLIDGGSAGWLGQAFCNSEECFDCIPKQREKVYPVCSIRQRPKNFEHCLIWAKAIAENMENLDEEFKFLETIKEESNSKDFEDSDFCVSDDEIKISNKDMVIEEFEINSIDSKKNKLVDVPNKKFKINSFNSEKNKLIEELKNTTNCQEIIYKLACFKAKVFSIEKFSFMESQTFLKKIVPSICTTNSIVASLMVLSNEQSKNFYLVQGSLGILRVDLNKKKEDCSVCSLPTYKAVITSETTFSSFLQAFEGETLAYNTEIYSLNSNELIGPFEGEMMVCLRNGLPNRIYFELGDKESVKRIR